MCAVTKRAQFTAPGETSGPFFVIWLTAVSDWYMIPVMKAVSVKRAKVSDEHGNTIEIKVWRVPRTPDKPHGLKYSLVYIVDETRVLGYDNAESRGDHRHYYDKEEPYRFTGIDRLLEDFYKDIRRYLRESQKS
jgi:hypothetical protein